MDMVAGLSKLVVKSLRQAPDHRVKYVNPDDTDCRTLPDKKTEGSHTYLYTPSACNRDLFMTSAPENTGKDSENPYGMPTDRQFVQALREGVDTIRMIFFIRMRDHLLEKHPERDKRFCQMLAGAILNELFGMRNPDRRFSDFAEEHMAVIQKELKKVPENFEDLLIPLTDALRMHFLCNHQEGMPDYSLNVLAKAKEYGILMEERSVPLPKGFMELVYRVGKAYGLIAAQNPKKKQAH